MEQVGNAPYDINLYPKYIKLAGEQDSAASVNDGTEEEEEETLGSLGAEARGTMVSAMAATSDVWLPLLRYQRSNLDALNKPEDAQTLLELFSAARKDYLSIPVLRFQALTLINLYTRQQEGDGEATSLDHWTEENVRNQLSEISSLAAQHISKSHDVWDLWAKWELELLEELNANADMEDEKEEAVTRIDEMFLARLRQPHSNYNATSELYSPFVSSYFPDTEYESRLVAATKARELPLKQLSWREGNPKRVREHLELRAQNGGFLEWKQYLAWEIGAKKPQRKFIVAVYERLLDCASRERWSALCAVQDSPSDETLSEALKVKAANLRDVWEEYLTYAQTGDSTELLNLARRATRALPESGTVWAIYMRAVEKATRPTDDMEQFEWEESIPDIYSRALQINLLQTSVEDFVAVTLTRASWSRRMCFVEEEGETVVDPDRMADVIQILEEGIATVRKVEGGDPKMRLEGFLSAFYLALPLPDNALEVLQSATKFYKTSSPAWLNYIDVLLSQNKIVEARRVFKDASQRKGLDPPEAVWDRWILFEYQFGTVEEVEKTLGVVKEFKKAEELRRKRAWEAYAREQAAAYASNGFTATTTTQVAPATATAVAATDGAEVAQMDVDAKADATTERTLKRKRSGDDVMDTSHTPKKSKHGDSATPAAVMQPKQPEPPKSEPETEKPALKRDRERTTVLVSKLPQTAVDDDLHKLFKDCGEIRELSIKKLPNELVATVEFKDHESIPGALTKDKKRVNGIEVAVSVGWESTLYITNFREGMDDAEMRTLFEKFGTILDVRWPSKRIKTTRRFCYVQYTTPAAAQEALTLNGVELEPGLKLTVLISDPTRKKVRTDAGARELRVTGVVKSVTKAELEKLFSPHGALKDVRLVPAVGNNQTAFIEYEAEESAERGLALNNHMLKGRRLAVTMADSRPGRAGAAPGAREETNSRSIRIKNVPNDTQEGILQQALEKIAPVVRVQLLGDRNEAIVELTSMADAGRVLLEHPTLSFNGSTLNLLEEGRSYSVASRGRGRGMRADRGGRGGRGGGSRAGLGMRSGPKSDVTMAEPTQSTSSTTGDRAPKKQDDFRKMLGL